MLEPVVTTDDPATPDPRRLVPRVDTVLADPRIAEAASHLGPTIVRSAVAQALQAVREGVLPRASVVDHVIDGLPESATSLRPVVNATGVLLHTNLGRAPLSRAAVDAVVRVSGTTDVELDLATGRRAGRGRGALRALAEAVPDADDVHVVNNGAAALALVVCALAATPPGRPGEVVVSRGELVEIGAGFRLPELVASTGAIIREVGTTNRTHLADYAAAIGPATALVLKVHPSNFVVSGFTSAVEVDELTQLGVPVVVDIGSGLLAPHPLLPDEPDAATVLRRGADLVTSSGDKLLGGPQAGLLLGRGDLVDRCRRHPMARALRVDKLTLAALEATLRGPRAPVAQCLDASFSQIRDRVEALVQRLVARGVDAGAVDTESAVGGGGAPGVRLPSAAVCLPVAYAEWLRRCGTPVVARVEGGRCLLDLRSVLPFDDDLVARAVLGVAAAGEAGGASSEPGETGTTS